MVETFREERGSIIIGGDFNEEDGPDSEMTKRMLGMGLVHDIAREGRKTPETHKQGKKTIDHIWVSKYLVDDIIGSGYCKYDQVFISDHRGSFISLRTEGGSGKSEKGKRRVLNSKNERQVERYLDYLREMLLAHNVFNRTNTLATDIHLDSEGLKELQDLDRMVTGCMLKAEEKLYRSGT